MGHWPPTGNCRAEESSARAELPRDASQQAFFQREDDCDSDLDHGFESDISIELSDVLETTRERDDDVDGACQAGEEIQPKVDVRPTRRKLSEASLKSEVEAFKAMLARYAIDVSTWTFPVAKLWWETEKQKRCLLVTDPESGRIKRIVSLVKIRVLSEIFGVEHALYSRLQVCKDGQIAERRQLPLRRLAWRRGGGETYAWGDEAYYSEFCPYTEDWVRGCKRALRDRLGLSYQWQMHHLEEDVHSHTFHVEDDISSNSFPGMLTLYTIHEVTFRVQNPKSPEVECIGLPAGQEFATTEGTLGGRGREKSGQEEQLNLWTWVRSSGESGVIKRVPIPTLAGKYLGATRWKAEAKQLSKVPNFTLRLALDGRKTDWDRVEKMSRRIGDPEYGLNEFYQDLSAFPELDLYLMDSSLVPGFGDHSPGAASPTHSTSGRTIGDEYQRTMGAFFAIFWLLRLGVGGKEGFTFGVDDDWKPMRPDAGEDRLYPAEQRKKFLRESRWDEFEQLLVDAEVLVRGPDGKLEPNFKRVMTLLTLTAAHDIMKLQTLQPTVQPEHAPYHGYGADDVIGDHDLALSYLMDHYPELLPSYAGLSDAERRSVQFTQCELCYNQGWLVQGEAPPGAIFTKFRQLLQQDAGVDSKDVALYFVHWLTDLAGAEPTPLGGCEKFVIKFPLPVLNSFLRSFHTVGLIATQTETQVYEDYLKMRWTDHVPPLGPSPTGADAIVRMRLLCMAQMNSGPILQAWPNLSEQDKDVLCQEMSRTGCVGQAYSADVVPADVRARPQGPALLIYYGPAFLQSLGSDDPTLRLGVLAEIYRKSRLLWPPSAEEAGSWVTVRIDAVKASSVCELQEAARTGDRWVVVRKNRTEAFVERKAADDLPGSSAEVQVLQVAPRA